MLSETAVFSYMCTNFYDPTHESGLKWNDPEIGIVWPLEGISQVSLSTKDENWKSINELSQ